MGIQDKAFTERRSQDGRQRFLQSLPEGPLTRGGNRGEEVCGGQGGFHQPRLHQGKAGLHLPRPCGQEVDSGTSLGSLSAASLWSCLLETNPYIYLGASFGRAPTLYC